MEPVEVVDEPVVVDFVVGPDGVVEATAKEGVEASGEGSE